MASIPFLDTVFHRYMRIPYALHVKEFQSPKAPRATYVLVHGIGNTLHSWDQLATKLPSDVRVIGVDLLGFGKSPKPDWAKYNAKTQARSLGITLIKMGLLQRPTIVGHSLGALVAVELAKRYPLLPRRLVLCSPPFYNPEVVTEGIVKSRDALLRDTYRMVSKYPDRIEKLSPLAVKLGLANRSLTINKENVPFYMAALESSIINQTSLDDVSRLKLPITIMYGTLDPFVVGSRISGIKKTQSNVTVKRYIVGHEIVGGYVQKLARYLTALQE